MQTPFGKGVVREVRNNRRLLVDVQGRALVVGDADVTALSVPRRGQKDPALRTPLEGRPGPSGPRESRDRTAGPGRSTEIDLHGMTVEEALAQVEIALSEAMLADVGVLRLIHGKSGGRIRAALHRWLGELPGVRGFRLDPRNDGVTIVTL